MRERTSSKFYPTEFKESAVKLALESDRPQAQIARELGGSEDTLYSWIRKYQRKPEQVQEPSNSEALFDELKRLRREVSNLKEKRDILVKAAAYFAKHAR